LKLAKEWTMTQRLADAMGKDRASADRNANVTFAEAVKRWLAEKEGRVSVGRFRSYESLTRRWLSYFAKRKLQDVTSEDVSGYLGKRKLGQVKGTRAVSSTTCNDDLLALRSLFSFAIRQNWLVKNPAAGIPHFNGTIRKRVRVLSAEEESRLLECCRSGEVVEISAGRNLAGRSGGMGSGEKVTFKQEIPVPDYLYPFVVLALNSGFRRRTLTNLCWKHLDLERKLWTIPGSLMKNHEDYQAPASQRVVEVLQEYRSRLLTEHGAGRVSQEAPIFGLAPTATLRRSFRRACKRAGLDKFTSHDCRRAYLNKLRQRGVGLETVMELTGHRSVATVLRFYREVSQDELRAAVATLDAPPPVALPAAAH
jgi:integrase